MCVSPQTQAIPNNQTIKYMLNSIDNNVLWTQYILGTRIYTNAVLPGTFVHIPLDI